jgi:DNA-binding IclR family transcriptional regulator
MKLNKTDEAVVKTLKAEGKEGLSLQEITDKSGQPSKKVFKSLKKLFEHEMVDTQARKYKLLTDKVPVGKGKENEEAPEEAEEE